MAPVREGPTFCGPIAAKRRPDAKIPGELPGSSWDCLGARLISSSTFNVGGTIPLATWIGHPGSLTANAISPLIQHPRPPPAVRCAATQHTSRGRCARRAAGPVRSLGDADLTFAHLPLYFCQCFRIAAFVVSSMVYLYIYAFFGHKILSVSYVQVGALCASHIEKHLEACILKANSVCKCSSFCFYIFQFSKILCHTFLFKEEKEVGKK